MKKIFGQKSLQPLTVSLLDTGNQIKLGPKPRELPSIDPDSDWKHTTVYASRRLYRYSPNNEDNIENINVVVKIYSYDDKIQDIDPWKIRMYSKLLIIV